MGRLTKDREYSSLLVTFIQCAVCAVCFAAVGARDGVRAIGDLSISQWLALMFLGLVCSAVGFVVLLWAVRRTSASRTSLLLGTEPLWAVVVAVVVGHEHLTALALLGGALIIGATYLAQGIELRHRDADVILVGPLEAAVTSEKQ